MGDSERSLPPEWETRETSGLSNEGVDSFTTAFRLFRSKGEEWWAKAELQAAKLITSIQPNPASETRRLAVAAYVTKVIKSCINCEVVKFGSVPLKTYLPDGDVDLTVICPNIEAKVTWIEDVHNALQKEIGNPKSKFRVTQVQLVSPQVQIIKMYIENLLVDVSFDQVGGLCTLCFLEEVDNLIGEDHLFKRSIILVKAWCFYESRLLGANCNLLSSYALEILVIHIFDIFHESLKGPLQVLYLFLEFFSCFDWDSYCVSLSGPIPLELKAKPGQSSTGIKDEKLERELHDSKAFRDLSSSRRERGDLLFTKAFLEACEKHYGLIPRSQAVNESTKFTVKSLNILDPLRRTNNLGRSVNQGNCARIRRAFVLGARTFRSLLQASEADVTKELDQFFKNCNLRQRPDVGPSSSAQGESLPNGAQKMGCARRSDMAKAEPDVPSQNGGHPASQARLNSTILLPVDFKESDQELHLGVHEGASAVESASHGEENTRDVSTVAVKGEVGALDLNGKSKTADSNGRMYHGTLDIDEDYFDVAKTRIPSPLQNSDPILSRSYEEDELSSTGLFSARSSPRECLDAETRVGCARISKHGTSADGIQQRSNGSTSSSSKIDSEEDDDSLSQSSLKGEHVTASESPSVLGVPDLKRGLLSLSCQSANSESCRNDSSSELQGRPPDPHHSTSVVASADAAPSEVQTECSVFQVLRFPSEQLSVRNEEEREFSYVSVGVHKQTGNDPGSEYPDISSSEGVKRKGKNHHQNGTYPSKELLLSSRVGQHGKSKRNRGRERRAQEGGQVSSSSGTAHSPQQASPVYNQHAMHPHRHSSSDATSGTSHFKPHPYSNATGTGSFRHQFDPGTARMPSGSSSSSHSPRPQYFAPYPYYPPAMHYPQFQHFAIYTPIQKRLPPAKWDGSSGANIFKSRLMDQDTIQAPGPSDFSVDSSTRNLNQIKISEQSAVGVGVVESLEAREEFATSENFRKSHLAKNGNSHGAEGQLLNGSSSSDFLAGNLKLHLDSLEYGRFCEQSCSPSVSHPYGYPALFSGSEQHRSWVGPGLPAQLMPFGAFIGLYPYQHQPGYIPQQFFPQGGTRPKGTGMYFPQLRQNSKASGGRNRGAGSQQHQEADKHHHHSREPESTPHHPHRAPPNKDEPAHAQGVYGTFPGNRSALKTDRGQEFLHTRSSRSLPSSPPVSSTVRGSVVNYACEVVVPSHPSELVQICATNLDSFDPLDFSKISCHGGSRAAAPAELLSERNVGSAPLPTSEFLHSEEGFALLDGDPQVKRGPSSYDLVQSVETPVVSPGYPAAGEVTTTATTSQKIDRSTYHMKEEDFPPLGGRRMSGADTVTLN